MNQKQKKFRWKLFGVLSVLFIPLLAVCSKAIGEKMSSYSPVVIRESFEDIMSRMEKAKPAVMKRQMNLLEDRYDLSDRKVKDITMSRGKPIQEGVRAKLPKNMTWEKISAMSPEEIKEKDEEGKEKKARTPLHHCMSLYSYHMKKLYKQEKGFDVQFYSKHANMRIPDYIYDKLVYFAKMKRLF